MATTITAEYDRAAQNAERSSEAKPLRASKEADIGATEAGCFHCGTPLRGAIFQAEEKAFCCRGCVAVFELLSECGLTEFYRIGESAGPRPQEKSGNGGFNYVDQPAVRARLVEFSDGKTTRVTFRIPAIHCIACVWLLENLFRLHAGIGHTRVNFPRKEVFITIDDTQVRLGEVVGLLASLGYEPDLKLSDLEGRQQTATPGRLWLQAGVAGFAFGNIMLLSISSYFGFDGFSGPRLGKLFGYISMALACPVLIYSAADYWKAAWVALKQQVLTIDVPIAVGIAALAGWSMREVVAGRGAGYFDTLAGLLFFLLCGKLFQQKTHERLAFDRDYKSFFPLSITRVNEGQEERVALSQLTVGDRLVIRHGELIPADARLIAGSGLLDYSFVTGESEPVGKQAGDLLHAGGRQSAGTIEVETLKAVSQSYLTSLWNQPYFAKEKGTGLATLTNQYSKRFTKIVLGIAVGTGVFWAFQDSARAVGVFVSVLIVACPCALALAAPFTLGTAQRMLARGNVFLKNAGVIETLARIDTIVFDKTGTLTGTNTGGVDFHGEPLREDEEGWVYSLSLHSTHPHAKRIERATTGHAARRVLDFEETPGCGMEGVVEGNEIKLGSASWLGVNGGINATGSSVQVVINGIHRGQYTLLNSLRPQAGALVRNLAIHHELALLSGDNERERENFRQLFGEKSQLRFNQSPMEKLEFINEMRASGKTVMMVGDGLNDAGALRQSDAGAAVVESVGTFSPASDLILSAEMVPRLDEVLSYSKAAVRVVRVSFLISGIYNVVGIGVAASGRLSPIICAILMPISSASVVIFACGLMTWLGRGLGRTPEGGA